MMSLRRLSVGLVLCSLVLWGATAQAQALKQLPAGAQIVVKVNNVEAVSKKIGSLMQRLGLAQMMPDLADPVGSVQKMANLRDGLNLRGDLVAALYPAADAPEPRFVVLIPVSNYKAFLDNLPMVKDAGDGVSSFVFEDGTPPMYIVNWGEYAAGSNNRNILAQKPTGLEVGSAAAQAQLDKSDIVVFANTRPIAAEVLPMFRQVKGQGQLELDRALTGVPGFDAKWMPAIQAVAAQVLNTVEQTLMDTNGATISVNISDKGVAFTVVSDFTADGYIGKLMAGLPNTEEDLLKGLPVRKYFFTAGVVGGGDALAGLLKDLLEPVTRALQGAGDQGKPILAAIDSIRQSPAVIKSSAVGMLAPTGQPGTQSLLQEVVVAQGDAPAITQLQRSAFEASQAITAMLPQTPGMKMEYKLDPGAATVGDAVLDKVSMKVDIDAAAGPEDQQAKMILDMIYGPNGMSGAMGAVSASAYVAGIGVDDETLAALVKSAQAGDTAVSEQRSIKAAAELLPAKRLMVAYVHADNIVTTALAYLAQFGTRIPLRLAPDMPPVGVAVSTENTALRIDVALPTELIENAVAAGLQAAAQMQQGPGGPPGGN
jgi:hypothetical protein